VSFYFRLISNSSGCCELTLNPAKRAKRGLGKPINLTMRQSAGGGKRKRVPPPTEGLRFNISLRGKNN